MIELDTAKRAADALIAYALPFVCRKFHFGIIGKAPPSVPHHWRVMNMYGVSFKRAEIEQARAWAVETYMAGYVPCVMFSKSGSGTSPNDVMRVLAGQPTKDEELARAWQEMRSHATTGERASEKKTAALSDQPRYFQGRGLSFLPDHG